MARTVANELYNWSMLKWSTTWHMLKNICVLEPDFLKTSSMSICIVMLKAFWVWLGEVARYAKKHGVCSCLFYLTSGPWTCGACSSCCSYLLQGPLTERASHFQGQHHPCIQENNHLPPSSRPFELPNASTQPHPKTSCPEWSRLCRELIV